MTNCPNCGSVIDPYKCKCAYCGTMILDLTNVEFEDGCPVFLRFRYDKTVFTAKAIALVNKITITESPSISCYYCDNQVFKTTESNYLINVDFECIPDGNGNTFRMEET